MSKNLIKVQGADFSHTELFAWLQGDGSKQGAVVSFTGMVRDNDQHNLQYLYLEHYPGMTEKCLVNIVDRARSRWRLERVAVVHRVGKLHINDNIVFVGVVSAHRVEAFLACQFIMDYLKKEAPFWKKEGLQDKEHWVLQKQSDLTAAEQW